MIPSFLSASPSVKMRQCTSDGTSCVTTRYQCCIVRYMGKNLIKENRKELSLYILYIYILYIYIYIYIYIPLRLRDRKKDETGGGAVRCIVFITITGISTKHLLPSACRPCPLVLLELVGWTHDKDLTLAGPCIITQFIQISQADATVLQVYYLSFCFGQHVSGASTPIIRSLKLH